MAEFYAVTLDRLYRLTTGTITTTPPEHVLSKTCLGVCIETLVPAAAETAHACPVVSIVHHLMGDYWISTPLVALFANEAAARRCYETEKKQPCDPRWHTETASVLSELMTSVERSVYIGSTSPFRNLLRGRQEQAV